MLISNVDKSVIVINSLETRLSRNDLNIKENIAENFANA